MVHSKTCRAIATKDSDKGPCQCNDGLQMWEFEFFDGTKIRGRGATARKALINMRLGHYDLRHYNAREVH